MDRKRWAVWLGWGLIVLGVALVLAAGLRSQMERTALLTRPAPSASPTPEPLIPTRTPVPAVSVRLTPSTSPTPEPLTPTHTPAPATSDPGALPTRPFRPTPSPAATPTITEPGESLSTPALSGVMFEGSFRWGIGVAVGPISRYPVESLRLGWYLDWRARPDPPRPQGIEYVQMVRLRDGVLRPDGGTIAAIARANPGSLWLIGNEPDVKWQDNVDPGAYARLYHEAYAVIKEADPTARVAIGGVSQPTPLRLCYLDAVLAAYREQFGTDMPVDVWNVHNFILREERGSWGVDIPPGMPDDRGMLYGIADSGNLEAFKRQIWDFRRWMAARGLQNRPLVVSEYGIPMPEDYGFPPERVVAFLRGTFDFFLTAADPALGYPADSYRLVQRWCWYSLDDVTYPTGRLFDPETGALTAVGEGWRSYVEELSLP